MIHEPHERSHWADPIVMFTDIDDLIAKHVAHLFIRDPVSLFSEKINQDDETDTDHFEVSCLPFVCSWLCTARLSCHSD